MLQPDAAVVTLCHWDASNQRAAGCLRKACEGPEDLLSFYVRSVPCQHPCRCSSCSRVSLPAWHGAWGVARLSRGIGYTGDGTITGTSQIVSAWPRPATFQYNTVLQPPYAESAQSSAAGGVQRDGGVHVERRRNVAGPARRILLLGPGRLHVCTCRALHKNQSTRWLGTRADGEQCMGVAWGTRRPGAAPDSVRRRRRHAGCMTHQGQHGRDTCKGDYGICVYAVWQPILHTVIDVTTRCASAPSGQHCYGILGADSRHATPHHHHHTDTHTHGYCAGAECSRSLRSSAASPGAHLPSSCTWLQPLRQGPEHPNTLSSTSHAMQLSVKSLTGVLSGTPLHLYKQHGRPGRALFWLRVPLQQQA